MSHRPARIETVEVKAGQVWKDWDARYRDDDPGRTLRVLRIDGEHAVCEQLTDSHYAIRVGAPSHVGQVRRIKLSRMRPTSSGYKLIQEAP